MATQSLQNSPGLVGSAMAQQAMPPAPAPAGVSDPAQGVDGQPLTADQQKAYDIMVKQAVGFLLQDQHMKAIIDSASAGNDPVGATVRALMPLMQSIYQAASQAGAKVDMVTVLAASIEVIANIAEMLATAGVITKEEIPQFSQKVAKAAVQQHNAGVAGQQGAA